MANECFCGCGRPVKGMRKRATNAVAGEVTESVGVLRGALDGGRAGERRDEVAALLAEGDAMLLGMRAFVHGEAGRDAVDGGATRDWLSRSRKARKLLDGVGDDGPPWMPKEPGSDVLVQTGTRANGVISDVGKSGWGNDRVASLEVTVTIRGTDGELTTLTRKVQISVTEAPRVGDQVEVAYDADGSYVYRPRVVLPEI